MENPFGILRCPEAFRIHYIPETTSTNDVAREARFTHGDIVIADRQNKGRGQRGNSWESLPGANLTFSIVLEPHFLAAGRQFLLSKAVSLAVVDTLGLFGIEASVKWPNDIYIGDKKVAGILIENEIMASCLSRSVVGIGLNVNQPGFSPELPNPVSMLGAAGGEFDRAEVLETFCTAFARHYGQLENGEPGKLDEDYYTRLYLADTPHLFRLPEGRALEGTIRRIGPGGELIVETEGGALRSFLFKEIVF